MPSPPSPHQRGYQRALVDTCVKLVGAWLSMILAALAVALLLFGPVLAYVAHASWLIIAALLPLSLIGAGILWVSYKAATPREDPRALEPLIWLEEAQAAPLKAAIERWRAGAPQPHHKLAINAQVNAAIWQPTLRGAPTLIIGAGLLDALNVAQLGAVLMHELAHAEQRAMRLGPLIEQTHRAIWRIVSVKEATLMTRFCAGCGRHLFGLLLWSATRLARSHRALVVYMERLADEDAAQHSGAQALVEAIARLEIADLAMQQLKAQLQLAAYARLFSDDLFMHHEAIIGELEQEEHLPLGQADDVHLRPAERIAQARGFSASHDASQARPALEDEPAWALFPTAAALRQQLTQALYLQWSGAQPSPRAPAAELERWLAHERALMKTPPALGKLYEAHSPPPPCTRAQLQQRYQHEVAAPSTEEPTPDQLWRDLEALNQAWSALRADQAQLEQLTHAQPRDFSFQGKHFERRDLKALGEALTRQGDTLAQGFEQLNAQLWQRAIRTCAQQSEGASTIDQLCAYVDAHHHLHQLIALARRFGPSCEQALATSAPAPALLNALCEEILAPLQALETLPCNWPTFERASPPPSLAHALTPDPTALLALLAAQSRASKRDLDYEALILAQILEIFVLVPSVARKNEVGMLRQLERLARP